MVIYVLRAKIWSLLLEIKRALQSALCCVRCVVKTLKTIYTQIIDTILLQQFQIPQNMQKFTLIYFDLIYKIEVRNTELALSKATINPLLITPERAVK